MLTTEVYGIVTNIIELIQVIESDPSIQKKYIGNNMFFAITEELDEFWKLAEIKVLITTVLSMVPKEEVQFVFIQKGYYIHYNTCEKLNNSGYIETDKGIITFIY